jgi:hypothetical protein
MVIPVETELMRIPVLAVLVLLALVLPAGAQGPGTPAPGDVLLALVCPVSPCRFRLGEVIQLSLSVTATEVGYSVEARDGLRERDLESFTAAPSDGVSDPLEGIGAVMNPSGIYSKLPLVPGKPFSVGVELNQWIRFGRPGKFQVTARSSRVFPGEYGVRFQIVSDPMDVEIVPADAQWQKEQLARILADLPAPGAGYSVRAAAAVRALGYLGSDDALREIQKRIPENWPFPRDFEQQNEHYLLWWEVSRLELRRHATVPER